MKTIPAIPLPELRRRYRALPKFPSFPGERVWCDRLQSFEDFLAFGPMTAELLAKPNPYGEDDDDNGRADFPELYALLMEAFPQPRAVNDRR